ncbi:MAG TPA: T9SS type A sorting domain-containing protein [Bacteroidia bacterium]|nr:T9SS type A sorting domain-containing protein [Bacteroidia bacterium]HNT79920.1 T9SS type A sorting domain-containing protein [Bacteroidia bacterium]
MYKRKSILAFVSILVFNATVLNAQLCSTLNLQFESTINGTCSQMLLTMQPDRLGRPYLYAAAKEGGLIIYDISNISTPTYCSSVLISSLSGLHVMNVSQDSTWLYLALGNHFGTAKQLSGIAIVDISNPLSPSINDVWIDSTMQLSGCGIVLADNDYAYVGAMRNGFVILDISNKNDIVFTSRLMLDIGFPQPTFIDSTKYNVRGLFIRDQLAYVCYDRGGIRIVDISDKMNPTELGQYSNLNLNGIFIPRAYNNVVVRDHLAYVTIDYCGLEILDISDSTNISLVSWWNPWNCPGSNPVAQWNTSDGHTNELAIDTNCNVLFISTGKSDLYVVDISNPSIPDSCGYYGGINNNIGTWGISSSSDKIFLSYICTLGVPFPSLITKIDLLSYSPCLLNVTQPKSSYFSLFPNPAGSEINVLVEQVKFTDINRYTIRNSLGQLIKKGKLDFTFDNQNTIRLKNIDKGMYFLSLISRDEEILDTLIFTKE